MTEIYNIDIHCLYTVSFCCTEFLLESTVWILLVSLSVLGDHRTNVPVGAGLVLLTHRVWRAEGVVLSSQADKSVLRWWESKPVLNLFLPMISLHPTVYSQNIHVCTGSLKTHGSRLDSPRVRKRGEEKQKVMGGEEAR